jgi:hypothetical protein
VRGYPSGGDAEYVTFQSEGVPFFPPATLSFLENSQLYQMDETVQRVEAVRGGTGALFASGQPGVTVNLVQREGGRIARASSRPRSSAMARPAPMAISPARWPRTRAMIGGYPRAATASARPVSMPIAAGRSPPICGRIWDGLAAGLRALSQ